MAKLNDLKKQCMLLHLNPIPTKNKVEADGTRTKTLSIKDCTHAIQQYYIEERKRMGTYDPSIEKILSFEPMLALQIKNLKPEVQEEIWDDNSDKWLFQEKIDGCFNYNTKVTLSDGTELPIGYIVDNKLEVTVKSYNTETGEIEAKRIVNWFDNGVKNNFKKFRVGSRYINCTDNHKFFDGSDYTEVRNLKYGYELVWYKDYVFQALLGSSIGDTTLCRDSRSKASNTSVRCNHSEKQIDYLQYKSTLFGMVWGNRHDYISGYGSRCVSVTSKTTSTYNEAYDLRYSTFVDDPYKYYERMGVVGLAFLFMDDGSNSGGQIRLSVNSFSSKQVRELHRYISSLGIKNSIGEEHGHPCIGMTQINARKFSSLISNYVHPSMRYKLHEEFRNDHFIDLNLDNSKPHLSKVCIGTPGTSVYFSEHAYDIEVEGNHNYFADGMLVHNCRCIITYSPALGFNFYSRNLSVTDQLPIAYKDNILLPEIDTSKLTFPFVLDSELVPVNKEIDKSGALVPVADTQLNLVSSILSLNSEDSIEIQKTNPMKFMVFDVLFLKEQSLFGKELSYRLGVLGVLYKYLRDAGFPIEIPAMRDKGQSKRAFYDSIVQAGGEGVIAKRLSDPYETKSERSGSWAKIKRKVSESVMAAGLGDTVDAFVIGFEPGTPGTANEHLVASLKFGVELLGMDNQPLEDQDGNTVIHHIATVSGLTQELKEAITYIDPFGNVALKPEIYGKVASIDGQDLSSRNMRFAHAVLVCWREDRSADTCRIREDILRKLIL